VNHAQQMRADDARERVDDAKRFDAALADALAGVRHPTDPQVRRAIKAALQACLMAGE
jgi:hypothetical protein